MNTEFQRRLINAGVKAGDEVMVQTLAPKELAETVIALGAIPVFVDSEPHTGAMYAEQLRNGIRSRFAETGKLPKAIVPMAVNGKEYNRVNIAKVAMRYEIPVVDFIDLDKQASSPKPLHLNPEYIHHPSFLNGVSETLYDHK